MIDNIFEIFSNREIAFLFWIFIIGGICVLNKGVRDSLLAVIKLILTTPILLIITLLVLDYTLLILDFLQRIKFWDITLLKDTAFWTIGTAFVLMFNSVNVKESTHFKKILLDVLKWTMVLEFVINFYTFSLITEIILFPVLLFIGLIQAYSELYPKHKKVELIFKKISAIFGLAILFFGVFKTYNQPETLLTLENLKCFLLPLLLTILFLPFIYCIALYSQYESLLVRLPFLIHDVKYRKAVKRQIFLVANFDLKKLLKISAGIAKLTLVDNSRSLEDIKIISK